MRINLIILFVFMTIGRQGFAADQSLTTNIKSIDISIYHDNSDTWKNISIDEENNLLAKLESKLLSIGFDIVKAEFCGVRSTKECDMRNVSERRKFAPGCIVIRNENGQTEKRLIVHY